MADSTSSSSSPSRYITTDNAEAKAVFAAVPAPLQVARDLEGTGLRLGYLSSRHPVSLTANKDIESYAQALVNPPALVPPGSKSSPLDRTISIDFVIHVEGEMELQLDSGETRIAKPGDITIQRATIAFVAQREPDKVGEDDWRNAEVRAPSGGRADSRDSLSARGGALIDVTS